MSDIAADLFKSIVTNTATPEAFNNAISQKMEQELAMRKVGLANQIYSQTSSEEEEN